MKSLSFRVIIILLFTPTLALSYDTSEGNISVSAGALLSQSIFNSSADGSAASQLGSFGFTVLGDINEQGSLEVGFYFLNKQYYREIGERSLVEMTKLSHISMGYRRWLSKKASASLSLGTGYSMGEVQVVQSDFLLNENVGTSARDTTEYTLDLAFQYELWRQNKNSVFLETRYSKSLTAQKDEYADHASIMLSWQVLLQNKDFPDDETAKYDEKNTDEK